MTPDLQISGAKALLGLILSSISDLFPSWKGEGRVGILWESESGGVGEEQPQPHT